MTPPITTTPSCTRLTVAWATLLLTLIAPERRSASAWTLNPKQALLATPSLSGSGWQRAYNPKHLSTLSVLHSTPPQPRRQSDIDDDAAVDRTSFDQAGASIIEEEDRARLEQMGDFDANPSYQADNIEKMRAAIRAKTAQMGLEKSKVSAEYIESRKERAVQAGPGSAGANSDPDQFAGLDLSKISSTKTPSSNNQWSEDMPSMFYDPEDELTAEEQEEVDPIMKLNAIEQGLNELKNAKWPDLGSAFREVILMLLVVAVSAVLIIGWDKILREVYTNLGFIPTKEDIANYASRFDGLDLPQGWTNNMNEQDVSQFAETVNANPQSILPDPAATTTSSSLPEL